MKMTFVPDPRKQLTQQKRNRKTWIIYSLHSRNVRNLYFEGLFTDLKIAIKIGRASCRERV